jgi:hypothetical protein
MQMIIIILLIACLPLTSFSQQADTFLSKFLVAPIDETVFLRWTITAGNTCEDTYIERSSDGISYERIGLIGGICGSPDQAMTYEFTDTMPLFNRLAYYRLELGYFGYSSPRQIELIRYNEKGFLLSPNPFSDKLRMAFDNGDNQEYTLVMIDTQGKITREMSTTDNEFMVTGTDLSAGIYFYKVFTRGQLRYSGKIIKI